MTVRWDARLRIFSSIGLSDSFIDHVNDSRISFACLLTACLNRLRITIIMNKCKFYTFTFLSPILSMTMPYWVYYSLINASSSFLYMYGRSAKNIFRYRNQWIVRWCCHNKGVYHRINPLWAIKSIGWDISFCYAYSDNQLGTEQISMMTWFQGNFKSIEYINLRWEWPLFS